MGLFDLASPAVFAADDLLWFLPPALRLTLWAVLTGLVGMALYRLISPQERLLKIKQRVRESRRALAAFDGDADEMLPVVMASLKSSFHHLGLTFGAALAASLPVLLLISPVAQRYSREFPEPGASVVATLTAAENEGWHWQPAQDGESPSWRIVWPDSGEKVTLSFRDREIATLPPTAPSPVIHTRLWWNWLFANPAGYLPADSPADALHLALPRQQFLGFGPNWMRGWEFLYFTVLIFASIGIKVLWRIE